MLLIVCMCNYINIYSCLSAVRLYVRAAEAGRDITFSGDEDGIRVADRDGSNATKGRRVRQFASRVGPVRRAPRTLLLSERDRRRRKETCCTPHSYGSGYLQTPEQLDGAKEARRGEL